MIPSSGDENVESARFQLFEALVRQRAGNNLLNGERRFPTSHFEDMGLPVLAIPSRLFYAFHASVEGYHGQREISNLFAEAKLLESNDFADRLQNGDHLIHIVDIGGGDGVRAKNIATYLLNSGRGVSYTCYDGSEVMLEKNQKTFEDVNILWHGLSGSFEDFNTNSDILNSNEQNIFLFLGNNYGNYTPLDIFEMFSHRYRGRNDLLIIGTDTPNDDCDGAFMLSEFMKYSDDRMRMGVFHQLGLQRTDLLDLFQYNKDRHQIEVYSIVKHDVKCEEHDFEFYNREIFLSNIARRPPITILEKELSEFFDVEVFKNADIDNTLALAICAWRE